MAAATTPPPTQPAAAPKQFGRFALNQLLGKSSASSTWLARDPRLEQDVLLFVPRTAPVKSHLKDAWMEHAQHVSRLKHPNLAPILEVGEHDGWPYMSCARGKTKTLAERLSSGTAPTPVEVATWMRDLIDGLAYAHEAGIAHYDLGLHNVLIDSAGRASLAGLGAGLKTETLQFLAKHETDRQQTRADSERDVLMAGLLMHRILAGHPALDDSDLGSAASRVGLEIVRLPWTTPHTVPETLRAIVNRATDRQQRQRYLNARTLLSAIQSWLKTNEQEGGGPLLLLLDRLNTVGHLPNRPGTEKALMTALPQEQLRVDDFVDVIVKNPALVWELLRSVNTATYRSTSADDGVTTIGRTVVLLGQQGLRKIASGLRAWPGVLDAQASTTDAESAQAAKLALQTELRLTCIAGHAARLLAPFSVHDEEASIAAMSQRLGWLLILYHFPEEAAQITKLMQAGPPAQEGESPTPGMTQEAATAAVLGIHLDDLTAAVMKHWGMHERLLAACRPLSKNTPVRHPHETAEVLRAVASLANELVTAANLQVETAKIVTAIYHASTRYARALDLAPKECQLVLEQATRLVNASSRNEFVNPI
ncbi:MAG: HDOD domain-containing protein [Burkholderiales bacterium]|nr:HDOD domain-containing protein [Burkholderiales bacterium]